MIKKSSEHDLIAITIPSETIPIEIDPETLDHLYTVAANATLAVKLQFLQKIGKNHRNDIECQNFCSVQAPKTCAFLFSRIKGGATTQFIQQLVLEALISTSGDKPTARQIKAAVKMATLDSKKKTSSSRTRRQSSDHHRARQDDHACARVWTT